MSRRDLQSILREVARRFDDPTRDGYEVRDALRMIAALLDRDEAKDEREHREALEAMHDGP